MKITPQHVWVDMYEWISRKYILRLLSVYWRFGYLIVDSRIKTIQTVRFSHDTKNYLSKFKINNDKIKLF